MVFDGENIYSRLGIAIKIIRNDRAIITAISMPKVENIGIDIKAITAKSDAVDNLEPKEPCMCAGVFSRLHKKKWGN